MQREKREEDRRKQKKDWRRTDGAPLQRRRDGGRERTDTEDLGETHSVE